MSEVPAGPSCRFPGVVVNSCGRSWWLAFFGSDLGRQVCRGGIGSISSCPRYVGERDVHTRRYLASSSSFFFLFLLLFWEAWLAVRHDLAGNEKKRRGGGSKRAPIFYFAFFVRLTMRSCHTVPSGNVASTLNCLRADSNHCVCLPARALDHLPVFLLVTARLEEEGGYAEQYTARA